MTGPASDPFEAERPRLYALAYRMVGERAAAEDVVQETWLRWAKQDAATIEAPSAWLRRTATRIAIDALRSARARREVYVGPWLPEPILADEKASPEEALALAQECDLALLWAMERLAPEERAAFILRNAFETDYGDIAAALGKSEAACRQLVSRASRRVKASAPRFRPSADDKADLLLRFAEAVQAQDRATVLKLLAPDVIAVSDGGGKASAALRPLEGAEEVAQVVLSIAERRGSFDGVRLVQANGSPALAILDGGEADMIYTIEADADGRIAWIYVMRNPDKLPGRLDA